MFFLVGRSPFLAVQLVGVGVSGLLKGFHFRSVSRRKGSAVGTILYIVHGRNHNYQYRFQVNGDFVRDDSDSCKTPGSASGCVVGALLEEFGAAGRGRIFSPTFTLACGLLLLGRYSRSLASPEESREADVDRPNTGPKLFTSFPTNSLVSNRRLARLPRGERG